MAMQNRLFIQEWEWNHYNWHLEKSIIIKSIFLNCVKESHLCGTFIPFVTTFIYPFHKNEVFIKVYMCNTVNFASKLTESVGNVSGQNSSLRYLVIIACLGYLLSYKFMYFYHNVDWLIDSWCLTPFSTLFQLYRGDQCTYPYFPGVSATITLQNILSKPVAAFPHNHRQNNDQRYERDVTIM